ncbi:MAG: hypothetical protein M1834_002739 [Cirrosporium novae-zelandiae]|nr:MAG: hypothetical protein M1834_002739 [Cirrosporium novae-zelandiae]
MSTSGGAWGNNRTHRGLGFHDQHTPVGNFNSREVEEALKRGCDGLTAAETKPQQYKPSGKESSNSKGSSPWGSKPNQMSNGKDFFLELRKQVTQLQQKENVAGG